MNNFRDPNPPLETRIREIRYFKKGNRNIVIKEAQNNKLNIEEITKDLIHKHGFEFTHRIPLSTTISNEAYRFVYASENYDLCNKILFQKPNPEPSKHLEERMNKAIDAILERTLEHIELIHYMDRFSEEWQQDNFKEALEEQITELVENMGKCYTHGLHNVRDNLYVTYAYDGKPFYMCEDCRHMEGGF